MIGLWTTGLALAGPLALAFYYGAQPPWSELQAFDLVVVDPDHVPQPTALALPLPHTRLAAYVALGEVHPSRAYAASIPRHWLVGSNAAWGSRLVDQAQPQWPRFFADRVVAPLWAAGYRTFFLDTLDSYQLLAKTPEQRAPQEAGMVAVVRLLRLQYPGIQLIFNRGFELLPQVHTDVEMVVAESLFRGYDAARQEYTEVGEADRAWLLGQLRRVQQQYRLPVAVIDYVPPAERAQARQTARQISELGLIPWVATPDLASLGVGTLEVMPRKVLVVHSVLAREHDLRLVGPLRLGAMPLNYLGYVPEFVDLAHLPDATLAGRYAGGVVWLTEATRADDMQRLARWLQAQVNDRVPLALVNPPPELLTDPLAAVLGLKLGAASAGDTTPVQIVQQNSMIGFEVRPRPAASGFMALTIKQGEPLLTLRQGASVQVAAALMPWGGYVLDKSSVVALPGNSGNRWVVNPFAFFQRALRLEPMPVPDVTTESGRRMLMVHMDGDGFVSRSELPGQPLAGQVVLQRIAKKYQTPMTLSVIEAELSPDGLYPALSSTAEATARALYLLPHVAPASHSFSHPFIWRKAAGVVAGYNLKIAGYEFDLAREIDGSLRYVQQRLVPPGKKVGMFLWTGDCVPGSEPVARTQALGVLNFNGGDTDATNSRATVSAMEGLGIPWSSGFQVFAPNQNENVYTNNWLGPFYGFQRVIETFELTERPRRLKPMDIYFHTYIATKAAGLQSLQRVFDYALAQPHTPVHVADYVRKVLDFQTLAVARTATGWRVRGATHLRTLRLPAGSAAPDLTASQGVAGFNDAGAQTYVHLGADSAELVLAAQPQGVPRLVSANARIEAFEPGPRLPRWQLRGYVPLQFTLANVQACQVRIDGRPVAPWRRQGGLSDFKIEDHVAGTLEALCQP